MEQPGRIFMIDNGGKTDGRYQSLLEEHGYEVFANNNAYQLIRSFTSLTKMPKTLTPGRL